MQQFESWRELVRSLIHDSRERQRLAEQIGVHPLTLVRWSTGCAHPRVSTLRLLCQALPNYREELTRLIVKEYANFTLDGAAQQEEKLEIPGEFYGRVLYAHNTCLVHLRGYTILTLILQQLLLQFDPKLLGMNVFIAQCVPPAPGQHVHSLFRIFGRGTGIWESVLEKQPQFFGAESLPGRAILARHRVVLHTSRELEIYLSDPRVGSALAIPLLIANGVVGTLCLLHTQPNWFYGARLQLAQQYVNLLMLAFETDDVFDLQNVELGLMPPPDAQLPLLKQFRELVLHTIVQASKNKQPLTHLQAEQVVWKRLEEQLLQLGLQVDDVQVPT